MEPAARFANVELSLIRQINALATPLSVNLGIGEPNVEPDAHLRELARRVAGEGSWHYSANAGTPSLRKVLSETVAPGYDPKSEICVSAGTQQALYAIFQAYVDPGDEVLLPNPGFVAYETMAKICGATVVRYPLEPPDWQIDPATLRFSDRTKLVVVNSPSNPLGSIVPRATLQAISAAARAAGALVVSDEIYREIWYDEPPASMLGLDGGADDHVIIINGMSKSHGLTGLRLGWITARSKTMTPIITAHQYIATCASVFSQSLTEAIFTDREWNTGWLEGVRAQFRAQRDVALHAIERELEVAVPPPGGAFYAFAPVPSCDTLAFARAMATDAAVLVIPGIAFGSHGEGFVRISYAASLDQIASGIERMGRYLRGMGR
jgi:aspartate/methionine/tyrosine aminotransferase